MSCTHDTEVSGLLSPSHAPIAPYRDHREALERLMEAVESGIARLQELEDVDPVQTEALVRTAKEFAFRLNDNLPPALSDAAKSEIRAIVIGAAAKLEDEGVEGRPLDLLDDILVRAESIRHILRDALDEHIGCGPDDTQELATHLVEWLPGISQNRIAELLDTSPKTLQRWLTGESRSHNERLFLVTRLVAILRHGWTPEGVVAWFDRPRAALAGKTPRAVLDDPTLDPVLRHEARQGRAQHGS